MRRVAITGLGLASPLGNDAAALLAALSAGRPAVARLDAPFASRLASPVAARAAIDAEARFPGQKQRMLDRVGQFGLAAAQDAIASAGLTLPGADPDRVGVFVGTGMGGAQTLDDGYKTLYGDQSDRMKPFSVLTAMAGAPAAWIALDHAITGPSLTYSTACSSSSVAIGEAWRRLRGGEIDMAVAGGAEAPLTLGTMQAWEALRTVATVDGDDPAASCRPFSRDRSGLVLGEGAAMLVLEDWDTARARGAPILAELAGYGLATDIAHLTRPSVQGQARAMRAALSSAQLPPDAIDYVNAHGTGTPANDGVECAAIREVFGAWAERLQVSSTKAMHGHLLGAAGALELAVCVVAMRARMVPPTANLRAPDPACDLDCVPNAARHDVTMRAAISSSFAFGGTNAVLVLRSA